MLAEYADQAKTGNEVLDTILTEKNVLCRSRGIRLSSMADGRGLDFIKAHHLYSLLGNAIDNAMEAVQNLPEEEREIILAVKRTGNLVSIHVENRCAGPVAMRGGLPVTTKGDRDYHGFGMLSMRTVAEQYGGTLTVRVEDGVFLLDAVMADEPEGEE